jgi:hypothetical protein
VQPTLRELLERSVRHGDGFSDFSVAGVHLRIVGPSSWLSEFADALAHRRLLSTSDPELAVYLRHENSPIHGLNPQSLLRIDASNPDCVQWLDVGSGTALYIGHQPLASYQSCAPLLMILQTWLVGLNRTVVHASALGTREGAILFVGRGGSGKTTTALMGLAKAMDYYGDDYCALSFEPEPTVYSLYSSTKFLENSLIPLPQMDIRRRADIPKPFSMLHPQYADHLPEKAVIRAVVVPTLREPLGYEAVSPQTALLALAPSTLFQLKGGSNVLGMLSKLTQSVPTFRMGLGSDPGLVIPLVRKLLGAL